MNNIPRWPVKGAALLETGKSTINNTCQQLLWTAAPAHAPRSLGIFSVLLPWEEKLEVGSTQRILLNFTSTVINTWGDNRV